MGAKTEYVSKNWFPEETQDWLNTKDYYASYCSLRYWTSLSHSKTQSSINPFKEDDMLNAVVGYKVNRSPDMIF